MSTRDNEPIRPDISHLHISPQDKIGRTNGKSFLVIGALLFGLLAMGAVVFFGRGKAATVTVITAEQTGAGTNRTVLNASGYVTPRRRATIAAKITGQIAEMLVDEGMYVTKGQVLARFDDTNITTAIKTRGAEMVAAEAAIAEIHINWKNAERNLERSQKLFQNRLIATKELDDARTLFDSLGAKLSLARRQLDVSRARLAEMKQELTDYTILSPFDGVVVSKDAQVGEIVSPISAGGGFTRTGIATIVDMSSLEIEVDINESFIAKVTIGQEVTATLDAYPDWRIPAKVRTVIPTADRQKATVKVRIAFDSLDPRILPDMGVKVSFLDTAVASESTENRVRIPLEAVRKEADRRIVFIYRDGRLESRAVKTGSATGKSIEIIAGVLPGERVVAGNIASLQDGQKVRLNSQ